MLLPGVLGVKLVDTLQLLLVGVAVVVVLVPHRVLAKDHFVEHEAASPDVSWLSITFCDGLLGCLVE